MSLLNFQFQDFQEESLNIPGLSEKAFLDLLDLTDGLKIIDNQLGFRSNQKNIARLISLFDGSSEHRQQIIDQGLFLSDNTLNTLVNNLFKHGKFTNESITKISDKLNTTIESLTQVEDYSVRTREILQEFKQTFNQEVNRLDDKIDQVKTDQDADKRIDDVISSWEAGNYYTGYSPLIQAVFALNHLAHDKMGQFIYTDDYYRRQMQNKIVTMLAQKVSLSPKQLVRLQDWLRFYAKPSSIYKNKAAVVYIWKKNDDLLYHRLLAEYIESKQIPEWLSTKQEAEMSVMLSANLLVDHFASELG